MARRDDALVTDATTLASMVPAGGRRERPYAMAPEQVRGEAADARTDLWALGVLLYEMVAGAKPFAGRDRARAVFGDPQGAAAALADRVAMALRPVIERCLEKDPARRYQARATCALVLETIQSGSAPLWTTWRYRLMRPALGGGGWCRP